MKKLFRAGLAVALLVTAVPAATAAAPRAVQLSGEQAQDVQRVQQYLNSIKTLSARFAQYAENGGTAEGTLYVSRPGNMRFQYDPPSPIQLVASNGFVVYHDSRLDETSYLPIGSTPAWFLLRNDIQLGGDVTIIGYERQPGALRLSLVQTKEPDAGSVTLTFADSPLELRQWSIVDPQGKKTTVSLSDVRVGQPIDSKLFVFKEPSRRERRSLGGN